MSEQVIPCSKPSPQGRVKSLPWPTRPHSKYSSLTLTSSSILPLTHPIPAPLAHPTPGLLHQLCPLLRTLFPRYLHGFLPHLHQVCSQIYLPVRPTLTTIYNMGHHHHPSPTLLILRPTLLSFTVFMTYCFMNFLFYCHYSTFYNVWFLGQWFSLLFIDVSQASRTPPDI